MDSDRIKGKARKVEGVAKQTLGSVTDDHSKRAEGVVDEAAGRVQDAWGRMKDEVRAEERRRQEPPI